MPEVSEMSAGGAMPTRRLGRTEHYSSVAIFGAAACWDATVEQAAESFAVADAAGVNHLDIAPSYGAAEVVIGPLVPAVRDRWFIAGKSDRTNPDGVKAHLERTMSRLGIDQLDLYQCHGVTSVEVLEQRSAALEVMCNARAEGLTRFAGITGHDLTTPKAQLAAVKRFDLDTVMFPVNPRLWADAQYRADAEELLDECAARDVGVQVIKAVAKGPWGSAAKANLTWYQPWTDQAHIDAGVAFALSTAGVTGFCTPGDRSLLPLALDAARRLGNVDVSDVERAATVADWAELPMWFPLAEHAIVG
jgi:aryl-alcohol dehydrogenase-like predicted oxidoreductase